MNSINNGTNGHEKKQWVEDLIILVGDTDSIEGGIEISEEFDSFPLLDQVDLLQDWLGELEDLYRERLDAWGKEIQNIQQ